MSDTNNKRNVIQLSFKNEGADLELYNFLKQKLSAPAYIKEEMWNIYKNVVHIPYVTNQQLASALPQNNLLEDVLLEEKQSQNLQKLQQEEAFSDLFQEDADRDEVEF